MNIYVIKTKDSKNNYISIGETAGNVDEYIKHTYRKQATETLFVKHNFNIPHKTKNLDTLIHNELEKLGYKRPADVNGRETFDFGQENGVNIIKAIIVALETNTAYDLKRTENFPPRKEQDDCIKATLDEFKQSDKFLWNCKMRFGKTFTAYQLFKRTAYKNALILTWKVAVEDGWQTDLLSHHDFRGINFINKDNLTSFDPNNKNIVFISIPLLLANKQLAAEDDEAADSDIKPGDIAGFTDKIKNIANIDWDLLIIDEAHYGTRATNTKKILEKLKYKRLLELSGTPFKILEDSEYKPWQIFNWTYRDEQKAKYGWTGPAEENPYRDLPDMKIYTFDGVCDLINEFGEKEFNINKIFNVNSDTKQFAQEDWVKNIIDFMCGETFDLGKTDGTTKTKRPNVKLPYYGDMKSKNKKSLWFLPDVASVCAMETFLKNHTFFKDYEIINATGAGMGSSVKSLEKFKELQKKTDKIICLSCGMLNTGVTIKELNSVVMLQDKHSAQDFFQSIFRCQSPYAGKSECYVFDFNPKRYFENMKSFSEKNGDRKKSPKENLEENLIATYLYLDGDMKSVTYDDLMRYITLDLDPEKLKRDFQRSNNFSVQISLKMSEKLLAIIDKIPLYKNEAKQPKKEEKKPTPKTTPNPKQPKTDTPAPPPMFEIRRSKIDILIASLTIFIYITNAQEENLYDIINTKETDLFEKICFMSVSDFNMLYENQVFREEILSKSIFRFKNQEAVSRDWNDIIREDILVA